MLQGNFLTQGLAMQMPLAERVRPKSLDQIRGQTHLTGSDSPLRSWLENQQLPSLILWGPPGSGKTTLAQILAQTSGLPFERLSAISAGVKEVRTVIEKARLQGKILLFLDEIHRFSKSQQDALLGAVEDGSLLLVGATTENPSFEIIRPLLSRCQVLVLKEHSLQSLTDVLQDALKNDAILQSKNVDVEEVEALFLHSGGDGRRMLNLLEMVVNSQPGNGPVRVSNALVEKVAQRRIPAYDKGGEQHYDVISAFIKSIRGSDADAALYWLARMLAAGEDLLFIARRLLILAAEDVGLANPNALLLAQSCFQACQAVGLPESRIVLSEVVIYLANSPKSNSAYKAINKAQELVERFPDLPVPLHLRNAPTQLLKELNYGKGYLYPHDFEGNRVAQAYLPEALKNMRIYEPGQNSKEKGG